jgi:hypothetical protein
LRVDRPLAHGAVDLGDLLLDARRLELPLLLAQLLLLLLARVGLRLRLVLRLRVVLEQEP